MSRITEHIEVDVPVRVAYDQWTQFESFPQFMEGVDRVVQLDDKTLEWTATLAGKTKHWRAEILEQRPDQVVSWRSTEGAQNDGALRFESLGANRTRVNLQLDVEPEGLVEKAGDALGIVERRVKGDLERFREFIEGRGKASGAWRGQIEGGVVEEDDESASGVSTDTGVGSAGMRQ
ncbi:MAG TPA: SRPBCC family protein [Candidatus Limnocylindrales bacterium]|nr:SRPBCC family protein [Candidatus Limnocylindrales bacterium]